jgi:hypothetical protein
MDAHAGGPPRCGCFSPQNQGLVCSAESHRRTPVVATVPRPSRSAEMPRVRQVAPFGIAANL